MITYDLTVYIGEAMREKRPIIKCHDTGVTLALHPVTIHKVSKYRDEVERYQIPAGATALLKIRKPDDTYVVTDVSIEDGKIICPMPTQSCTAPGICKAEVQLFNSEGKRLTTATFEFEVTKECLCGSEEESKPWVDVLGEQVKDAVDAAASAKANADLTEKMAQETAANADAAAMSKDAAQEALRGMTYVTITADENGHILIRNGDLLGTTKFNLIPADAKTRAGHLEVDY